MGPPSARLRLRGRGLLRAFGAVHAPALKRRPRPTDRPPSVRAASPPSGARATEWPAEAHADVRFPGRAVRPRHGNPGGGADNNYWVADLRFRGHPRRRFGRAPYLLLQ